MHNVVIHQPQFLPFEGFWHRLAYADTYVACAGMKFSQSGHGHRVTMRGKWCTMPVKGHQRNKHICDVILEDAGATLEAAHAIREATCMKPYAYRLEPLLDALERFPGLGSIWLVDLQALTLPILAKILDLRCAIRFDTDIRLGMSAVEKLDDILGNLHPKEPIRYLTSGAARGYLVEEDLTAAQETRYQRLSSVWLDPDSIVQLIAEEADPLDHVRAAAAWETREGELARVR